MNIVALQHLVYQFDFLHCIVGRQFELRVVEADQLIAQTINIASEASLARQHIVIVIYILVKERPILQLFLRVVDGQLLRCQGRADRVGFQGLSWLLNSPKLSPYLVTNA